MGVLSHHKVLQNNKWDVAGACACVCAGEAESGGGLAARLRAIVWGAFQLFQQLHTFQGWPCVPCMCWQHMRVPQEQACGARAHSGCRSAGAPPARPPVAAPTRPNSKP